MLLASVILLTGCPGPGVRIVDRESTTALIKEHHVCVVSPLKPQERITAIQINSDKSPPFTRPLMASLFMYLKVSVFRCSDLNLRLVNGIHSPMMFNLINQSHI